MSSLNKTYLSDPQGNKSLMRLMSFIALITSIILAFIIVVFNMVSMHSVSLVSVFVFGAFAPKALQRFAEFPSSRSYPNSYRNNH